MATLVDGRLVFLKGFKFSPTDEEVIADFLNPIANGVANDMFLFYILSGLIYSDDLYASEPWNLPAEYFRHGDGRNEAFILTRRHLFNEYVSDGCWSRVKRNAGSGKWQGKNGYTKIVCSSGCTGRKNSLSFRKSNGSSSEWIMHEYILDNPEFQRISLCKIYKKPVRQREEGAALAKERDPSPTETTANGLENGIYWPSASTTPCGVLQTEVREPEQTESSTPCIPSEQAPTTCTLRPFNKQPKEAHIPDPAKQVPSEQLSKLDMEEPKTARANQASSPSSSCGLGLKDKPMGDLQVTAVGHVSGEEKLTTPTMEEAWTAQASSLEEIQQMDDIYNEGYEFQYTVVEEPIRLPWDNNILNSTEFADMHNYFINMNGDVQMFIT